MVLGPHPRGILLEPLVGTEGMTLDVQDQSRLAQALQAMNGSNLNVSLLETKRQLPFSSQ